MTLTGAIVLYAVIWFLTLYMALPMGVKSQGDVNEVVPGTPASAPTNPMIRKKIIWTTVITTVLWCVAMWAVIYSGVHINDLDWFGRVDPE